ncbi:MAG: hypothetical protein JSS09_08180 [Verrucomicrobia bacterium]|nr:hypothetical protein [Verrucomicrobiota bacterium]
MSSWLASMFSSCFPPPTPLVPLSAPFSTTVFMKCKSTETSALTFEGPIKDAQRVLASNKIESIAKLTITDHWDNPKPEEARSKRIFHFSCEDGSSGDENPMDPLLAKNYLEEALKGPVDTIQDRAYKRFHQEHNSQLQTAPKEPRRSSKNNPHPSDWEIV